MYTADIPYQHVGLLPPKVSGFDNFVWTKHSLSSCRILLFIAHTFLMCLCPLRNMTRGGNQLLLAVFE